MDSYMDAHLLKENTVEKSLENSDANGTKNNVPDVVFFGNENAFKLLCKASSQAQGWMKSTKAMQIEGVGCVVQVSTHQRNHDGTNSVAEALTFVPGVRIQEYYEGGSEVVTNRELVQI